MENIIIENENFILTLTADCTVRSLVNKKNGEECILSGVDLPFFSVTQDRPFNNEVKLAYMNKRTTFAANRVYREGERLVVGFEVIPYLAYVDVEIKDRYIAFTLSGFEVNMLDYPAAMEMPPITAFNLCQIAVEKRHNFGQWINVCHTEKSRVAVVSTSPYALCDNECIGNIRIVSARCQRDIKLVGVSAALVVTEPDAFLDAIEDIEHDYGLPGGVQSRRNDLINASIYWTNTICPENVLEHIKYCKMGGFRLMLINYQAFFKKYAFFETCGDCDFRDSYPKGIEDARYVIETVRAAGIIPGFHFLHTHIGLKTRYASPVADHRLNLKCHFTLCRPLDKTDDVIYVNECPARAPLGTPDITVREGEVVVENAGLNCQVLKFGGELIFYSGYSTEHPYCFTGCKRGYWDTNTVNHPEGEIGGVLDVSEYGGGMSAYLDQNSDLQEEYANKLAEIYKLGCEFIYFDGSEGTNLPYEFHIPNAQYRVYKAMGENPIFCEGAAKAHFGWHILSGANAFDIFPDEAFKKMIIKHPFKEALNMRYDYTRVNFGWWEFRKSTSVDIFEFGTSKAAALDCPGSVIFSLDALRTNPRTRDVLEVVRRWECVRATKWLTEEQKLMLSAPDKEFTLLINEKGKFELRECIKVNVAANNSRIGAYRFARCGENYVQLWDNESKSTLVIKAGLIASYTNELGGDAIEYTVKDGFAYLPVSNRAYIRFSCDINEQLSILEDAKILLD